MSEAKSAPAHRRGNPGFAALTRLRATSAEILSRRLAAWGRAGGFLSGAPRGRAAQGLPQVDDLGRLLVLRRLDLLAVLLALDDRLQRALVLVLELARLEVTGLAVDDVGCRFGHV